MSRILSLLLLSQLMASLLLFPGTVRAAETLRVAVAANFKPTLEVLAEKFSEETSTAVDISLGSTGALYAQIRNGAPFHIFFAADAERPQRLEDEGYSRRRQAYALGQLVFWRPGPSNVDRRSVTTDLVLAIANPRHAPSGNAANSVLKNLNITPRQLVQGNNVAQAYAFVATGNAPAGFVSLAQVKAKSVTPASYWLVPQHLHAPIRQELIVLKSAPANADELVDYVIAAADELNHAGYLVPAHPGEPE